VEKCYIFAVWKTVKKTKTMEIKFKEKHYKKGRFNTKSEQEMSQFKKDNITQDFNEIKQKAQENLNFYFQILKKKDRINIPEKENSVLSIRTQSQINAFSIIIQFIEKYGHIDFISIQSYTIDEKTVFCLHEILSQGKIKQLQIIMTETASFRTPKIYKLLKYLFSEQENCNLCFYWVHSKVHLIRCGENKFVIDGSGNLSSNAQVEHYNVFKSEQMFDFDYNLCNDFFFGEKLRKKHEIFKNF
jgi:hypothetical protein